MCRIGHHAGRRGLDPVCVKAGPGCCTAGDAMQAPLPEGYDTCLLANLVHYFSAEENQHLLSRVRGAVGTGARLLLADFWTDPTHTEPLIAALMAGEFAVHIR